MVLGPNVGLDLLFSVVDRQMVDDAHASGALGRNGRGSVDHFGMHGKVDVQVGTLSKAIGALGGYVCGTRDLIDYLYHRARPFLFSTSHPPSGGGKLHRRLRHSGDGAGTHRAVVGQYALLSGRIDEWASIPAA